MAHEPVGSKMRDLRFGVAGDMVGKSDLQAAPFLSILMPWLDLFALEAGVGVEEGRSEVGPKGLAGEIGPQARRAIQLLGKNRRPWYTLLPDRIRRRPPSGEKGKGPHLSNPRAWDVLRRG